MKKSLLAKAILAIVLFFSVTQAYAQAYVLKELYKTNYAATVETGATLSMTSCAITTVMPTWAPTFTSAALTSSSSGFATLTFATPLVLTSDGSTNGVIIVNWGAANGRPLNVSINGGTAVTIDPTLASTDRSKVREITYSIPTSITSISSIKLIGASGSGSHYFSIKVDSWITAGPQAPKVSALSIDGTNGVFANDSTIKVNLPYATYSKGDVVATSSILATTDSTSVDTTITASAFKGGAVITTFNVGDTIKYTVEKSALSRNYYIITSADVPSATCTNPTNASQSVKAGIAISPIVFTTTNASSVVVTGLPTGVAGSLAAGVLTISGAAAIEASYPATYTYTVKVDSLPNALGSPIIKTGTITVKDPSAQSVAFINSASTTTSALYTELSKKYDVEIIATSSTPGDTVANSTYMLNIKSKDLIVLHESVSSTNVTASAIGRLIGVKPILNTKVHMYKSPAVIWPTGTGANGAIGDTSIYVKARYKAHPIFSGLSFKDDSTLTIGAGNCIIRTVGGTAAESLTKFNIANGKAGALSLIETNNGTSTDAAKYMMIPFLATGEAFNANGIALLNSACTYLMGTSVFAPVQSSEAKITSLKINTVAATIDEAAKTITLDLVQGTNLTALAPVVSVSPFATLTAPVSLTAVDFTNPVVFTVKAEDGTLVNYTVTVTATGVPTGVESAQAVSNVYSNGSAVVVEAAAGAKVSVLSISGVVLYSSVMDSTKSVLPVSLEKGAYVVVVNGTSEIVIIK